MLHNLGTTRSLGTANSFEMRFSRLDSSDEAKVIRMAQNVISNAEKLLDPSSESTKALQMARATYAALVSASQQTSANAHPVNIYNRSDEAFVVRGFDRMAKSQDPILVSPKLTDIEGFATPLYSPSRRTSTSSLKKTLSERVKEKKETRLRSELSRTLSQSSVQSPEAQQAFSITEFASAKQPTSPAAMSASRTFAPKRPSFFSHAERFSDPSPNRELPKVISEEYPRPQERDIHERSPIRSAIAINSTPSRQERQLAAQGSSRFVKSEDVDRIMPIENHSPLRVVIEDSRVHSPSSVRTETGIIEELHHNSIPTPARSNRSPSPAAATSSSYSIPSTRLHTPSPVHAATQQNPSSPVYVSQAGIESRDNPRMERVHSTLETRNELLVNNIDNSIENVIVIDQPVKDVKVTSIAVSEPEQTALTPDNPFFNTGPRFDTFQAPAFDSSESDSLEFSLILNTEPKRISASSLNATIIGQANASLNSRNGSVNHTSQNVHENIASDDEFSYVPSGGFDTSSPTKDLSGSSVLEFGIIQDDAPAKTASAVKAVPSSVGLSKPSQSKVMDTSFSSAIFGIEADDFDVEDL